jgi:hypothetical protein
MKCYLLIILFSLISISKAGTLEVMSYNVENLFDTKHDVVNNKDKEDWAFLPKDAAGKKEACAKESNKHLRKECLETDWNDKKLEIKISQIADVVKAKSPNFPDFLGLVEVENSNVVSMLGKKLGYEEFEITESPDPRGVDVALLYKKNTNIKKISKKELVVENNYPTRNILEVEFLIAEKYPLTLFVNHWPSLHNPDSYRVKAAEVLRKRVEEILKANPNQNILAMGDFNTIDTNNPHPFKTVLYKDNLFIDVATRFFEEKSIDEKIKKSLPSGTYYYGRNDEWNMLDHFFVVNNLIDQKEMDIELKSFDIFSSSLNQKELKRKDKTSDEKNIKIVLAPKRFDPDGTSKEDMGYSDHFPIDLKIQYPDVIEIKKQSKKTKKAK